MKHLAIPFEETSWVRILKGRDLIHEFKAETATSPVEQFQALLYRDSLALDSGLLFILEDPAVPVFVNTRTTFPVDTIQFDEKGHITHLGALYPSAGRGSFVTAFQCKHLLMLPFGFNEKHKLVSYNESRQNKSHPFGIVLIKEK